MDGSELERRVDDLESRIAFMQRTIEELNEVVIEQHNLLDRVKAELKEALIQLRGTALTKDNDPPPHY